MKLTEQERYLDRQVRTFLVACSMLHSVIGTFRLHESEKDNSNYIFDNKDVEHAIEKVYRAYENTDINNLDNIWNSDVINNLIMLIKSTQSKIPKAVLFVRNANISNKNDILDILSFESNSMSNLKKKLSNRLDVLEQKKIC